MALPPLTRGNGLPLAIIAAAYLLVRTWLTVVRWMPRPVAIYPYVDVGLVTAGLISLRNPTDPLSILYFIPLASAVASMSVNHLVAVGSVTVAAYLAAIIVSGVPWTIGMVYRIVMLALMSSLYWLIIRVVTTYVRSAERGEYRAELSREIHDGVQHLLVTLGTRLELARHLVREAPGRAEQILAEERETARRASDEMRYLVRRLRAAVQHSDFAAALRTQIAAIADRWPFALDVDVPPTLPRLSPKAEHAVLRVIQESLTNVAKHAQASRVAITISTQDGQLRCAIADNGTGFDPASANGAGLTGLRERVQSANGTLEVSSEPGRGAMVVATFPVPKPTFLLWRKFES
ncbi:MAG: sensor histidine kinase [Armatimonadetes bacterium]|nr:sensor histidine kinase [Armatimonadota bacterium]